MLTLAEGNHFNHPLSRLNPLLLLAMFTALILNVLGGVTRRSCNFVLRMLKVIIGCAIHQEGGPSVAEREFLARLPIDIRSIRRAFDLDPVVTVFAACPACSATYEPSYSSNTPIYPARCQYRRWAKSAPCNAKLTIHGVRNAESVRLPRRPFAVQDFDLFIGRMLCRPGMEDILKMGSQVVQAHRLNDIKDASVMREFRDKDGRPFLDASSSELRLLWCLSVDWFNPYLNKIAGRSVSEGSVVMCCLLLPPSLRYRPENLYLMGVIPGPREPSLEEVDHFMRPLVDKLVISWDKGVWYSRTYRYPRGRLSRSAIALLVTDLPGGRKVAGLAGHSAACFCLLCFLKLLNINNIDMQGWTMKTREDIIRFAEEWRNATTKTQQKALYQKNGVRWSQLLRLPYWDPTRSLVVDGMHNLFLGLVQYHVRSIIGMDTPVHGRYDDDLNDPEDPDGAGDAQTSKEVVNVEKLLHHNNAAKKLERVSKRALQMACRKKGIEQTSWGAKRKVTKKVMVEALLVSERIDQ